MNVHFSFMHHGFSLVELMVAMVVSLLLLSGVVQVFSSSKQSSRVIDGYSRLQENGRFAIDVLSRNIRLAGYKSTIWEGTDTSFPSDPSPFVPPDSLSDAKPFDAGQVITGTDGPSGAPDSITIRYQGSGDGAGNPDGLIEDCLGGDLDSGNIASIRFSIDLSKNELECAVDGTNGGAPQPLIDGVENMQIVYGVDTDADFSVNQFVTQTQIDADPNDLLTWNSVVGVRIALLLNTVQNVSTRDDNKSYDLVGTSVTANADLLRRHRFVTTINIRNRTP